jgi:hypothetical protein
MFLQVLSSNHFGYIPYYIEADKLFCNIHSQLSLIDLTSYLQSVLLVDRVGKESMMVVDDVVSKLLD